MSDRNLWLETSTADLQVALDEIERDIPPAELEAWLASFGVVNEA